MNTILQYFTFSFLLFLPTLLLAKEKIVLGVGHSLSFTKNLNDKIYITNGNAVKAKQINDDQILLVGKALGKSEVHIGKKVLDVQITSKHAFLIYQKLEYILDQTPHLKADLNMHCPAIAGKLLRWEDWEKIQKQMSFEKRPSHCKQIYQFNATIDPVLQKSSPPFLAEALKHQLVEINYNQKHFIKIYSSSFYKNKDLENLIQSYGLELTPSSSGKDTNKIYVELLAVSESDIKNTGILLPREFSYDLQNQSSQTELLAKLNLLADSGKMESLLQTNLQLGKKRKASFHSGGEIPIPLSTENSSQVIWKSYGFIMNLETLKSSTNKLLLRLDLELSNIDSSVAVGNIPSLQKHEFKNEVELFGKQRLNVFHFVLLSDQASDSGFHFLKSLPLFNKIFSQSHQRKQNYHIFINIQKKD